jgi:hypothetical protein
MENHFKYQKEVFTVTDYYMDCPFHHETIPNFSESRDYKKKPYFKVKSTNVVETIEELKKHYGDITKKVKTERVTLVVEESEKSVALKLYLNSSGRGVGKKYFGRSNTLYYVTYNKKYKNFYSGLRDRKGYKTKRVNTVKTNYFSYIQSIVAMIPQHIRDVEMVKDITYSVSYGYTVLDKALHIFVNKIYGTSDVRYDVSNPEEFFFKTYYHLNGFKLPDAYKKFIGLQFAKKDLKKHKNIVNVFMKDYELRGSKIRKILNSQNNIRLNDIYFFYNLLGVDYFNMVNEDFFKISNRLTVSSYVSNHENIYELNNSEKKKLVKILNNKSISVDGFIQVLKDHLKFKEKLRGYGEDVKIRANNVKEFNTEHTEWSTLLDSYRKGLITRTYSVDMKREIEEIIIGPHIDYYPMLLTTTNDYVGESQHQKNCVRTYTEHANCFIVSLREGGPNGKERATIEYRYRLNGSPNRVQSLGRHNQNLSSNWNYALESLDQRVKKLHEIQVLVLPKIEKRFPNGKVTTSEAKWEYSPNKYPGHERSKILQWSDDYQRGDTDLLFGFIDNFDFDDFLP